MPDHDGKFRDEITQEFTIELDGEDWLIKTGDKLIEKDMLVAIIEEINERMNQELQAILEQIKKLGGRDYTEG